jgi:hypothetical protein
LRVLDRFFLSPAGAAVFLPASFFSAGAFPAGAFPAVVGFFSALGGILSLDVGVWYRYPMNVLEDRVGGLAREVGRDLLTRVFVLEEDKRV